MNLQINKHEIKKVFTSPIVITLIILFISYNLFIIYQNRHVSDSTKYTNYIIKQFGNEVNEKSIEKLQRKNKETLMKLNKMTEEKFNKVYTSIDRFLESNKFKYKYYDDSVYSDKDRKFIDEVNILNEYSNPKELIKSYEELDMIDICEKTIKIYGLEGDSAKIVRENYAKLSVRFENIINNKEHMNIYFLDGMHSFMYGDILKNCIYQILILVILVTSFLTNYEFDNKTSLLVYSTKRGRINYKDKLLISIVSSLIIAIIILLATFSVYFVVFDYSEIFNVPLSNIYNWEYIIPNIGWFNVTVLQHFMMSIIIVLISSIIFTLITFFIAKLIKNSYITFFIFFILFGIVLIAQSICGKDSSLLIYSSYNIFQMILNPHGWFMEKGYLTDKYYEIISIILSSLITVVGCVLVSKRFKSEDLV